MNVSYNKLWKLLIDKGITKADLQEMTGISSRTLAKLTHDESVTTETLVKIGDALHCDIGDMMSFVNQAQADTLYAAWKVSGEPCFENELIKTYSVTFEEKTYRISLTKRIADKRTIIHCADNMIQWEQLPKFPLIEGHIFWGERENIARVTVPTDGSISLFVISGKPDSLTGLDDGIFRSSRHPGGYRYVHVMSMAAFKLFVPDTSV